MALHVLVAHNGAKWLLGRGNCVAGRHDVKNIFRGVSVEALTSVNLLQLWHVSTAAMILTTRLLTVSNGDLAHQWIVVTVFASSSSCSIICGFFSNFVLGIPAFLLSHNGLMRFSHLHEVILLKLLSFVLVGGFDWVAANVRQSATLVFWGYWLLENLSVCSSLDFTLSDSASGLFGGILPLNDQRLVLEVFSMLLIG